MSDNKTQLGVEPNVGGLLCYAPCCIGFIFSIVAAVVEKQNRFLRFHAFQSLLFHAALILCSIAINVASVILSMMISGMLGSLFSLVGMLLGLGGLAVSILMMIKANGNEEFRLPVIGDMAAKWV